MNRESGNHELSDLRHPPSAADRSTEWKGDIFLEDEQFVRNRMQQYAIQSSPDVDGSLLVYDVVSGMLVAHWLCPFYGPRF